MDRDKVIKGLKKMLEESKYNDSVNWNPWADTETLEDAIALLKAQAPRVMTWEEAQENVNEGPFIIIELRASTETGIDYGVLVCDSYEMSSGYLLTVSRFGMLKDEYGKHLRMWTSRPTDAQREETPWNT